jgi:hypothetical protein
MFSGPDVLKTLQRVQPTDRVKSSRFQRTASANTTEFYLNTFSMLYKEYIHISLLFNFLPTLFTFFPELKIQ